MLPDINRNKIGEIIFKTVSRAIQEMGQKMNFSSWEGMDEITRKNYMDVVGEIEAQIPDVIVQETEPSIEGDIGHTSESPQDDLGISTTDSSLLKTLTEGHPELKLAPEPPPREEGFVYTDAFYECGKCGKHHRKSSKLGEKHREYELVNV